MKFSSVVKDWRAERTTTGCGQATLFRRISLSCSGDGDSVGGMSSFVLEWRTVYNPPEATHSSLSIKELRYGGGQRESSDSAASSRLKESFVRAIPPRRATPPKSHVRHRQ